MGWPKEAFLHLRQIVTPLSRPQNGGNLLFVKSDNELYLLDADGTEHAVGGGGGGSLTVQDENSNVGTSVTQIDFQGAGVTAAAGTGEVVVTVPAETLAASIIDAKGDLIAGTAADTAARVAVGTDGKFLTADSSQTPGVGWGYPKHTLAVTCKGVLTVQAGTTRWYNDFGYTVTIASIRATVDVAPSGGSVVVDVNKNGTTLFTTQANRPTITTTNVTSGKVTNMDVTTVADGDYLTVDVDTTTSPAQNLVVEVVFA